jgi:hypothetical protein
MSNVIEFHQPTRRAKPQAAAPKFNDRDRNEWKAAVKAVWADQSRWRVSRRGNPYIVLHEIGVCAVIERTETEYWTWEIRRRGKEPVRSQWDYVIEQSAFDAALEAVIALA